MGARRAAGGRRRRPAAGTFRGVGERPPVLRPARWLGVCLVAWGLVGGCRTTTPGGASAPPSARSAEQVPGGSEPTVGAVEAARARRSLARRDEGPTAGRARVVLARRALERGDAADALAQAEAGLATAGIDEVDRMALVELAAEAAWRTGAPEKVVAFVGRVPAEARTANMLALAALAIEATSGASEAAVAFLTWASATPDRAERAFARARARAAVATIPLADRRLPAPEALPEGQVRDCLAGLLGIDAAGRRGPDCRPEPYRVGLALPASGRLSGLWPDLYAGAVVAAEVLGPVELSVVDTARGARAAVRALAGRGARAVVGPLDPRSVAQAEQALPLPTFVPWGDPGSSSHGAVYLVPPFEDRVRALVGACPERRIVVLAPSGAFGDRAVGAAEQAARGRGLAVATHRYDPKATSFRPVADALGRQGAGRCVAVLDHAARADNLVRQLRRRGALPLGSEQGGPRILLFGDGLDPARIPPQLVGALATPPVVPSPADRAFEAAYRRREGKPPSPLARLAFRALRRACGHPALPGETRPMVVRVASDGLEPAGPPGT